MELLNYVTMIMKPTSLIKNTEVFERGALNKALELGRPGYPALMSSKTNQFALSSPVITHGQRDVLTHRLGYGL